MYERHCTSLMVSWPHIFQQEHLSSLSLALSLYILYTMSSTSNTNVHHQHEHPCLELLDQIEWQTNDIPRLPNTNTTTDATTIVAYFPGKASLLLPPLYQTSTGRILTKSDLQPTTTTVSSTACNHVAVERCEQALVHVVETNVLPQLVFVALLEEGLAQLVSSTTTTCSNNNNSMGGGISSHPFPSERRSTPLL